MTIIIKERPNLIDRKGIGGEFCIQIYNEDGTCPPPVFQENLVVDAGIKHLGDILAGIETTNLDLAYIEPGEGTSDTTVGMTDTEDVLEGTPTDRLAATSQTRSTSSPFEVTISAFINSTDYTRPQTITELNVFFGPQTGGDLFARGKLSTPVALTGSATATISYSIVFR